MTIFFRLLSSIKKPEISHLTNAFYSFKTWNEWNIWLQMVEIGKEGESQSYVIWEIESLGC